MKRIFLMFGLFLLSFILIACNDNQTHESIFDELEIEYQNNDNKDYVTSNILFNYRRYENIIIDIESTNEEVLLIEDNTGIVTRLEEDTLVTVNISITFNEETKVFPVIFKVIKITDEEELKLEINITDFTYMIGDDIPDYKNFTATFNNLDVTKDVVVDDLLVDFDVLGTYTIIYKYTIEEITYEKRVLVSVVEFIDNIKPVILGTKDFTHIIGDNTPNYLEGVSASDNIDSEVSVTVDASLVDLTKEGKYPIYFVAEDSSGNKTTLEHEVIVIGSNQTVGESITETFENAGNPGSGYKGGSFVGVEGIKWNYKLMRNDQELNKRAMTFHNKSGGRIYATLKAGLSYFSIDAKNEFSGSDNREFALYINDELIETFHSTSNVQTFEVENLDYKEETLIEIRNTGNLRVTIDNVTLGFDSKTIEEKYLDIEAMRLTIPENFLRETKLELITNQNGVDITWEYQDLSNINNSYLDLNTGEVTMPENNNTKVNVLIKAILEYEGYILEKLFTLSVGEGEPISINSVRNMLNNSEVKTKGIITSSIKQGSIYYAFIEDDNSGIYIQTESLDVLTEGTEVIIKGIKDTINGIAYLKDIYDVLVLNEKDVNAPAIKLNNVNNYLGRKVFVEGYLKENTNISTNIFSIVSSDGSINITIPSYAGSVSKINNQSLGQKVLIEGFVYNTNTIYLLNNNDITIEDSVNEQAIKTLILNKLTLPNGDVRANIELPTQDLVFNKPIEWLSTHDNIISDTGIFNRPDKDTTVTLYYEIDLGTIKISGSIQLIAYAVEPLMPYYSKLDGLSGSSFNSELSKLIKNTGTATGSTSEVKSVDNYNGKNYNIYTGFGGYGNREHVWPQSKLGSVKDDLHNLRAAVVSVNSSRSNFPFTEKPRGSNGSWQVVNKNSFYPGDEYVGDVARIVLYISIRYNLSLNLVGNLEMFLRWHEMDPVNDFELSRNEKIFGIQKNRNPFIDYPEFVGMYFNSSNNRNIKADENYDNVIIIQDLYLVDNRNQFIA